MVVTVYHCGAWVIARASFLIKKILEHENACYKMKLWTVFLPFTAVIFMAVT